jgi:hypothetical protein
MVTDPDGDLIRLAWDLDGRSIADHTSQIEIDTGGLSGGIHGLTVRASDGRGGIARQTRSFAVKEKLVIPFEGFKLNNIAKAILDRIALRMRQDPLLKLRVIGCADDQESKKRDKPAGPSPAAIVTTYLEGRGVEKDRTVSPRGGEGSQMVGPDWKEDRGSDRWGGIELHVR